MPQAPEPVASGAPLAPAGWSRRHQDLAIVLWPSFLAAAAGTMLFFAAFDPQEFGEGSPLAGLLQSRNAGYAAGFFFFWLLAAAASALTLYLARTQRPTEPPKRAGAPDAQA
jgi:hypothetical protein